MQESPTLKIPSRSPVLDKARGLADQFKTELASLSAQIERMNASSGLQGVFDGLASSQYNGGINQDTATMPYTLYNANNYVPITLNRPLLNYSYMTQGLLRTLVDQPVTDAFRGGVKFKSSQLDDDDLKLLNRAFKRKRGRKSRKQTELSRRTVTSSYTQSKSDVDAVKETAIWARLFGGAGLIINTNQSYMSDLNVDAINEDAPLEFIAADRWELLLNAINIQASALPCPYNYYGLPLHRSRVIQMLWAEAPSLIRPRLQGWGMSILEESIRAVNAYLKFEKLLFELLDEAKIDVYKIKGFNASLASSAGTRNTQRRIELSNQMKNFQSALTMDAEDDYQQKTLTFTGIAEIYDQLRTNLCAYLKFPRNKLFGESAGGFGSGKDSLENYNATLEAVRERSEPLVMEAGELRCQQLFGFIPEDLEVEWSPLDVMDGVEQETVATSKQNRAVQQFQTGLLDGKETSEVLMKQGLLLVESQVLKGLREPEPPMSQNPDEMAAQQDHESKLAAAKPKPGADK